MKFSILSSKVYLLLYKVCLCGGRVCTSYLKEGRVVDFPPSEQSRSVNTDARYPIMGQLDRDRSILALANNESKALWAKLVRPAQHLGFNISA